MDDQNFHVGDDRSLSGDDPCHHADELVRDLMDDQLVNAIYNSGWWVGFLGGVGLTLSGFLLRSWVLRNDRRVED